MKWSLESLLEVLRLELGQESRSTLLVWVGLGAALLYAGCGATNFSSASGSKGPGASGDSSAAAAPVAAPSADAGVDGSGSNNGTNTGTSGGTGKNNSNTAQNGGTCKTDITPLNYNILFVFDKTLSQLFTDPTLVRRTGALQFLSDFAGYVNTYPNVQVNMGVMAFNTVAIPEGSWSRLSASTYPTLQQEITTATSDPDGATSYSPAFIAAAADFAQLSTASDAANARNYVIFLTDGLPDADTATAISTSVNNLVTQQDVAVIAVATGPDVPASGEATVQALALPTTAGKFPDHVGHYYRAATATDLANVWTSLIGDIGACTAAGTATGTSTGTASITAAASSGTTTANGTGTISTSGTGI